MNRHEEQIATVRKLKYYFKESNKLLPMSEVLNNVYNSMNFMEPACTYMNEIGVKLTVNL